MDTEQQTVEELAGKKFRELTEAERKLLQAAQQGTWSECGTPNPGDAGPDGSRYIPYRPDNGAWLNAAEDQPWLRLRRPAALGWTPR